MWRLNISLSILLYLLVVSYSLDNEEYYKLLEIDRSADAREIRKAFKQLAVTMHPDKNTDNPKAHENFLKIAEAYEVLKDPSKRQDYDLYGKKGFQNNVPPQYRSYTYYRDQFGIYDDDPLITTLSTDDFENSVTDGIWFVNFYSPMCSHCHHLAPEWRKLSKRLEGVVKIAAVNCEDDRNLCWQLMIRQYPTVMFFTEKATMHTAKEYVGDRTAAAMDNFLMAHLMKTPSIVTIDQKDTLQQHNTPWILFLCSNYDCSENHEYIKLAALLKSLVSIGKITSQKVFKEITEIDIDDGLVFWQKDKSSEIVPWSNYIQVANHILQKLPQLESLTDKEYEDIKTRLRTGTENPWLVCFTIGSDTSHEILMKRLTGLLNGFKIAQINCGRYGTLCSNLHIFRYPLWAVLKKGGAMELYTGKITLHGIERFAIDTSSASNLYALTPQDVNEIMGNGNPWMIGWLLTGCPPCKKMLPALRKASMHFEPNVLRFGTIDCAVHSQTCNKYNVHRYPTAVIYNGTSTITFQGNNDEHSIIDFIKSMRNNHVIKLDFDTFYSEVGSKPDSELWIIEFFASWCGPCQRLQPEWRKLAAKVSHLDTVHVGAVDCVQYTRLCEEQGIVSYPTIKAYPYGGRGIDTFSLFPRDLQKNLHNIHKWLLTFVPSVVRVLTDDNFEILMESSEKSWLVMFFAPWCGYCHQFEPDFVTAIQIMAGSVIGAKVDCQAHGSICSKHYINSYPTVKLYQKSQHKNKFSTGITLHSRAYDELVNEVKSVAPEVIITPVDHDEL